MKQIKKILGVVLIVALMATVISCGEAQPLLSQEEAFGIAFLGTVMAEVSIELAMLAEQYDLPPIAGVTVDIDEKKDIGTITWDNFDIEEAILALANSAELDDEDLEDFEDLFDGKIIIRKGSSKTFTEDRVEATIILHLSGFEDGIPEGTFTIKVSAYDPEDGEEEVTVSVNGVRIDFSDIFDF